MRLADIVTSLVLAVFAVFVFGTALGYIESTLNHGARWYQSAGLFPAIVAAGLFLCAVKLFFDARRELPPEASVAAVVEAVHRNRKRILAAFAVFGWIGFYVFILMRLISYVPATFIFIVVLIIVVEHRLVRPVLIAALVTAALYGTFAKIAMIPLP